MKIESTQGQVFHSYKTMGTCLDTHIKAKYIINFILIFEIIKRI